MIKIPQYGKRWIKTEVKRAEKVAYATEMGRLKAIEKFKRKEKFTDQMRDYVKNWLDRIDPLELLAIGGATVVVHDVIFKLDKFITQAEAWKDSDKIQTQILAQISAFGIPVGGIALDILQTLFPDLVEEAYGKKPPPTPTGDILLWIISLAVAYYAIKHGADLISVASMFWGGIS